MAHRDSVSGQVADLWELFIGAGSDRAPLSSALEVGMLYEVAKKTSAKTGSTPQGAVVIGTMIEGKCTFNQSHYATFKELMNLPANAPSNLKVAGDDLPGIQLRFHDPKAVDNAGDIVVLGAVFTSLSRTSDGQGLGEWEAEFFGVAVNGVTGRIGEAGA